MHVAHELNQPFDIAVIVADDALRASLVLLFAVSGMRSTPLASVAGLSAFPVAGPKLLVIDWSLLKQANSDPAQAIKEVGSIGPVIVMTEDDQVPLALIGSNLEVKILAKPFTAEDVLGLIDQIMNSVSETFSCAGAAEASSRLNEDSSPCEAALYGADDFQIAASAAPRDPASLA